MRLGDNNFYNLFARAVSATCPDRDCDEWTTDGVRWRRQRHVLWSGVSFQVEIHELVRTAKPEWAFVFVHETWWGTDRRKAIRNSHWARVENGNGRDVLAWFAQREKELN